MNLPEVGKLLLFASGLDRFVQVDQVTTSAWHRVLSKHEVTYAQAEQACIDHYTGPEGGKPFTVAHVVASAGIANRATTKLIQADVRAARARRIVEPDWPESRPLTEHLSAQLRAARDADRAESIRYAQIEGPVEHMDHGLTFHNGVI